MSSTTPGPASKPSTTTAPQVPAAANTTTQPFRYGYRLPRCVICGDPVIVPFIPAKGQPYAHMDCPA